MKKEVKRNCLSEGCNNKAYKDDAFCVDCGDKLDEWFEPLK